ncbi:ABC transporter permease, partial [Bacillus sp. D-CC]
FLLSLWEQNHIYPLNHRLIGVDNNLSKVPLKRSLTKDTPDKRWEIVVGYIIGFGIFAFIQSIIIVSFSVYILDLYVAGSIWLTLLITCMLSLTALTLGTFLSAYANNEFQIIQFIPLVIVPQIFFFCFIVAEDCS